MFLKKNLYPNLDGISGGSAEPVAIWRKA